MVVRNSALRLVFLLSFLQLPFRSAAENYLDYYRSVAIAESSAVNGQYGEALAQYKTALQQFSYSNPIDYYVAAQLAAVTGDTSECRALLRRGISFGLPRETVRSNPHLSSYLDNSKPHALPRELIDSCWAVYRQRIDQGARSRAIFLIRRDQAVIQKAGSIYGSDGYTLRAIYQPFWDSLLHEVISITETSGFPAQKIAGTMNGDDGLFAVGPNSVFVYYIVIHHGNAWPQMSELLGKELERGNITPQMYAAIADHSNGSIDVERKQFLSLRPCQDKACAKFLRQHLARINANRSRIGLCSYEVMEQKHDITRSYLKWATGRSTPKHPVFDFQPELHFTGRPAQAAATSQ